LDGLAIVLLVLFNGYQIYGIVAQRSGAPETAAEAVRDTTRVPMQINVLNGCGVSGVGSTMTKFCRQAGYDVVEMGNYTSFDVQHSIVIDRNGKTQDALRLAAALGIPASNVVQQFSNDQMVAASVVIGKDYQTLTPWNR
ncbi:MAG: LytR C-terminal domain-containing protein, partial [Bacteroidetes bacterium]|nr:LytR C-terminal domain-containing protein [Bacteroidota bacterium]